MVQFWLPGVPLWVISLVLMSLMTGTNLLSVGSYGEFEYWFAGIKVAAIALFLILGTLFVVGVIGGEGPHVSNLTAHGGLFPKGLSAIFASVVIVVFSMVGAEIATIGRPSPTTRRRRSPGPPTLSSCGWAPSTSVPYSCWPA